ncbi:MAG: transposase zinc-binding domain-containing protein, partial [Candidatus Methanoperedenaceae archaeon]|nr:transposase zinc-binding domain-containing protein [Candidatus Methanoperedenaceae archaeon]
MKTTIALILFTYSTWDEYQVRNKDSLRQVIIENVERFRNCRKPQNGYRVYQCPECVKRGIDKEKLLSDIQHMKHRGEAY